MSQPTLTIRLRLSTIPTYQRKKLSYFSPYPTIEHKKDEKNTIHNSSNTSENATKTQKSKKKKSHKKASKEPTWRSERMGKTTKLLLQKNK